MTTRLTPSPKLLAAEYTPHTRVTVYYDWTIQGGNDRSYSCALEEAFPDPSDLAEAVRRLRAGQGRAVFGGGAQPACEVYVD